MRARVDESQSFLRPAATKLLIASGAPVDGRGRSWRALARLNAIDVQHLIRRGTLGANALDPTRPHRLSRRLRVRRALAAVVRDTSCDSRIRIPGAPG
jgi:hypothetical protein